MIYSVDLPAKQNPLFNLCWRITNGKLEIAQRCQVLFDNIGLIQFIPSKNHSISNYKMSEIVIGRVKFKFCFSCTYHALLLFSLIKGCEGRAARYT